MQDDGEFVSPIAIAEPSLTANRSAAPRCPTGAACGIATVEHTGIHQITSAYGWPNFRMNLSASFTRGALAAARRSRAARREERSWTRKAFVAAMKSSQSGQSSGDFW